ncbi:unnamed protein product [Prunus brigantina]
MRRLASRDVPLRFPALRTATKAISGVANGSKRRFQDELHHNLRTSRARSKMSDSESGSEREPNAYEGESSDGLFDTDSGGVAPDAEDGSDTDVEILGECSSSAPSHGIGKGFMTAPVPLTIVYADGRQVVPGVPGETSVGQRPDASISGRGGSAAEPSSRSRVSVVFPSNPRVSMGVPKEHLFGVDYLEPNKITELEIAKYRREYFIPDSVRMRIPTPTECLSKPKDGDVVFFTDVLLQGVRLPLQPAVQKTLTQIGYAPGQFNPNFWVALVGVVTAFGMAGLGEPSYEQFSYLYSITRSKCKGHGGWVQANCLRAAERGHFVSHVPTSQKSWKNRRVLLSGDWESPSGHPVRFHIPTTFQIAGSKLKQPVATQAEIRQIDQVRLKVPAVERVYPQFLFTPNLIKAKLANPAEMTEERRAAEAKSLSESSKRRLMMGLQGQKKKKGQQETVPTPSAGADVDDQSLGDHLRQMSSGSGQAGPAALGPSSSRGAPTEGASSRAAGKRVVTVDLDAEPASKRGRQSEVPRAIFSVEDDDGPTNLACPAKTVQFANHMILGSQMELPKKLLREEAGRPFRLQASASMDMWLCVKRAINAAEKAKKAYEDGRAKVAEAGKAIQANATLASEIEAAIRGYHRSSEFSNLLDSEVGGEMTGLLYRFKRYNPGKKLNLNFIADPPPLPEGITEEMIEQYEREVIPELEAE